MNSSDEDIYWFIYPHLNPRLVTFSIKSVLSCWRMLGPVNFLVDSRDPVLYGDAVISIALVDSKDLVLYGETVISISLV